MNPGKKPLVFAQIGDPHITDAKQQNYLDLLAIVAQLEIECSDLLDFVYLPGDIADHGFPSSYKLVATALKMLSVPVYIVPGDHDMEQGGLAAFYQFLNQQKLPRAARFESYNCIFLDVCGPGRGGPDFRLGKSQLQWLTGELERSHLSGKAILVFMHTYPADLAIIEEVDALNDLILKNDVIMVNMGHAHYNEIANDGHTIFTATRSTGQIEEGPVGYSLTVVDEGVISWRFKQLQDPFPFVLITTPSDYRLLRSSHHLVTGKTIIRALVFGQRRIKAVTCHVGNNEPIAMMKIPGDNFWTVEVDTGETEMYTIMVEAVDEYDRPGRHTIRVAPNNYVITRKLQSGSDALSIGEWSENGISGTQLGPNRNGKPFETGPKLNA